MSLKPLIRKQKLRIDDHKRGAGEIKDWNDPSADIHLDKETYLPIGGQIQNVRIKIPLNSDSDISIKNNKKQNDEIPRKLLREIKDALKDKKARQDFVEDIVNVLKDYESALSDINNLRKSVEKIARHFDLGWSDTEITARVNGAIESLTKYYTDNENKRYFIRFDKTEITIGEKEYKIE